MISPKDLGYYRGALDAAGVLASRGGAGHVTDWWRGVITLLLDELEAAYTGNSVATQDKK